ncbi:MAG: hypothetical protein U1F48_14520 [Burkholderiales bacterium]
MTEAFTWLYIAGMIFLVIVGLCWIVLPFAILGTKPLLRTLIAEQQRTNALLEQQRAQVVVTRPPDVVVARGETVVTRPPG